MILSPEQVVHLVKEPKDSILDENIKLQNRHKIHIHGDGFESVLKQIIGYETVEQFKQKKLLSKPFTRSLFKKIINEQSRWKTAWGTSKFYAFDNNSDELSRQFQQDVLSQVWKNESIEVMVNDFLYKAIYEEFNGFLLVEKGRVEVIDGVRFEIRNGIKKRIEETDQLKPYIVFISAEDVHAFKLSGKTVEFIVIKAGKHGKKDLFRVIDDRFDYIVEKEGNTCTLSTIFPPIEHGAGRCPVSTITSINRKITDDRTKTSPVDETIDLLDYYLHQFAEHLVTEILHAHPNFYQVAQRCMNVVEGIKCDNGWIRGSYNGKEIDKECPSCRGQGVRLHKDASTATIIPPRDNEGKPFNLSNPMGYVTPPIDILQYQIDAIDWMRKEILSSALGDASQATKESLVNSATEVIANNRSLQDIIAGIIEVIEGVETNLSDIIGKMFYGDRFIRSEIIYSRKISIKDENTLIKEISESKQAGASYSHIKTLNEELTRVRHVRSNTDLQRNIMLNDLEPLIGFSFNEVESSNSVDATTKELKQNFVDLIQRFEEQNGKITDFMPEAELPNRVSSIRDVLLGYLGEDDEQEEQINNQNQ